MSIKRTDFTGEKYGRLTLINFLEFDKSRRQIYTCKCDCGQIVNKHLHSMKSGKTQSCGCLHKEVTSENGKKRTIGNGIAARNGLINNYKESAKKRKIPWNLTNEQFIEITSRDCYYCGIKPLQNKGTFNNTGNYIHNGIDRIENDKGYEYSNSVPCCKNCNYAKRNMSLETFYNMIKNIYERHIREVDIFQRPEIQFEKL